MWLVDIEAVQSRQKEVQVDGKMLRIIVVLYHRLKVVPKL